MGLPVSLTGIGGRRFAAERLVEHMRRDKKVRDGRLAFILPREIGDVFVTRDVPETAVRDFLTAAA